MNRGTGTVLEMGGGTNSARSAEKTFSGAPHFLAVPLLVSGYVPNFVSLRSLYKHPIWLMLTDNGDNNVSYK
jgi:predicted peptidase